MGDAHRRTRQSTDGCVVFQNPYAEWYENSLRIKESPTWKYHVKTYEEDFEYEKFADLFTAEKWDPHEWADLFKKQERST